MTGGYPSLTSTFTAHRVFKLLDFMVTHFIRHWSEEAAFRCTYV